jgi:hypothetical protein
MCAVIDKVRHWKFVQGRFCVFGLIPDSLDLHTHDYFSRLFTEQNSLLVRGGKSVQYGTESSEEVP